MIVLGEPLFLNPPSPEPVLRRLMWATYGTSEGLWDCLAPALRATA